MKRRILRQPRDRHEPELRALAAGEDRDHALLFAAQEWKRLSGRDNLRGQQRANDVKLLRAQRRVHRICEIGAEDLHACITHGVRDLRIELLCARKLNGCPACDQIEPLAGRQAGYEIRSEGPELILVNETAHAHHEKFIQIRGPDREKLQPLVERKLLLRRLQHHAVVKGKPAQLTVEKHGAALVQLTFRRKDRSRVVRSHLPQRLHARKLIARHVQPPPLTSI